MSLICISELNHHWFELSLAESLPESMLTSCQLDQDENCWKCYLQNRSFCSCPSGLMYCPLLVVHEQSHQTVCIILIMAHLEARLVHNSVYQLGWIGRPMLNSPQCPCRIQGTSIAKWIICTSLMVIGCVEIASKIISVAIKNIFSVISPHKSK